MKDARVHGTAVVPQDCGSKRVRKAMTDTFRRWSDPCPASRECFFIRIESCS